MKAVLGKLKSAMQTLKPTIFNRKARKQFEQDMAAFDELIVRGEEIGAFDEKATFSGLEETTVETHTPPTNHVARVMAPRAPSPARRP